CRLRRSAPSFCDESLFGAKPVGPAQATPWMRKEDVVKLYSLLWTPPPAPRDQPSRCHRAGPLRAIHSSPATAGFESGQESKSCVWKHPRSNLGCEGQGAPSRGRSQSLSRLNTPSNGLHVTPDNLKAERCRKQSSLTAPPTRGRSQSVSRSPVAMNSKAVGGCKPRPPWK
ncbi:RITA1 protein, partial [Crotophaga sulcirostris]|nr:RITA1 protein [Crotophaga sulcirostris]